MKSRRRQSPDADVLRTIEQDLAVSMAELFERYPTLYGFTVQDCAAPPELMVTDLGIFPPLGTTQCEEIYDEIAAALLDFMSERPAAKDVLRGRTIVRVLH